MDGKLRLDAGVHGLPAVKRLPWAVILLLDGRSIRHQPRVVGEAL
jgi:hypothetical protein